jgi:hypothetical protein
MFVLYSLPASYLAWKFKSELDSSALFNISLYLTSFFLRAFLWMLVAFYSKDEQFESAIIILEYAAAYVIEISNYFFVYEMEGVRVLLKSQSFMENELEQKRVSRNRMIVCTL